MRLGNRQKILKGVTYFKGDITNWDPQFKQTSCIITLKLYQWLNGIFNILYSEI